MTSSPPVHAEHELVVRVNDATGVPGGMIAVTLRTYASRPIGQGQLCLETTPQPETPAPDRPVATVQGSVVYSDVPDVSSALTSNLEQDPQSLLLQFSSASASVNASDGPLAVFFMQLTEQVLPGETYELILDLQNSSLTDENGVPVSIVPRNGRLTIRAPGDPIGVAASAEDAFPGGTALLSFETFEPIALASGRVGIRYDAALAGGPPVVTMNPRHGSAIFSTDTSTPGLVVVDFGSPDRTLNRIPGDLIDIDLPLLSSVTPGTQSPVMLDEAMTFLVAAQGQILPLSLGQDMLVVSSPPPVSPGSASGLRLGKGPFGTLELAWDPDCGSGTEYAVYRGDLEQGYDSLGLEPGFCSVAGAAATISVGLGSADFFLIVPHTESVEGGYGRDSDGDSRSPAIGACLPQGVVHDCGF